MKLLLENKSTEQKENVSIKIIYDENSIDLELPISVNVTEEQRQSERDLLFDKAVDIVAKEGKVSTSFLQRHLAIGYNRAARIVDQMESEGMIGPANHVGKREVLIPRN